MTNGTRGILAQDVWRWFQHHPAKSNEDLSGYDRIRRSGESFAMVILENTPPGPDQSVAIRKVREAMMTANAAIACVDDKSGG